MPKDDSTWLNVCYAMFGLIIFFVGQKAFQTAGVQFGWIERYDEWFPRITIFGSLVIAIVATIFLRRDQERHEYFLASIGELRKVIWPTPVDTRTMTTVVVAVVSIFCVILTVFDAFWSKVLKWILAA